MRNIDLDLLRQIWIPFSFVEDENCRQSLKVWLSDGDYYVNHVPPNLSLFCLNGADLKRCLSLDAFQFSAHAAQTMHEMEKTSAYEKLTSWRLIQAYYAAYFAGHALLRFFGRSFSHLESGHIHFLNQRCLSEAGYSPSLASSYYLIEYHPDTRNVTFKKYSESHKGFWKCFLDLILTLEQESLHVRASDERRQELSAYLRDIADALTNRGQFSSGNWLSTIRNEANYKSLDGVWFPFSKATPSFGDLLVRVKDWRIGGFNPPNPNLERNELKRFFVTALVVVDLGISLSLDYQILASKVGRRSNRFSRLVKQTAAT